MTNKLSRQTWETALGILLSMGKDKVSMSINNKPIDLYDMGKDFSPNGYELTDSSPKEFIEWDNSTQGPDAIYVWIWTADNPQYKWLIDNTKIPFSQGIFRVCKSGTIYVSSVEDGSCFTFTPRHE